MVRVILLRDVSRFEIAMDSPFSVRDGMGRTVSKMLPPIGRTAAHVRHQSPTALRLGSEQFSASILDLVPQKNGAAALVVQAGTDGQPALCRYPGVIRCLLKDNGRADIVNIVDVEDYLRGVLRGEVYPNWQPEMLRAQAIASRTYVLHEKNTLGRSREWDVTATQRSQMYLGLDPRCRTESIDAAVEATRGIVLTWRFEQGDRIFCTYYSSCCGGVTQDASHVNHDPPIPPLAGGVRCEDCWRAPKSSYRWGPVRLLKRDIARALRERHAQFSGLDRVDTVLVTATDPFGRARTISVVDGNGRWHEMKAENFRLTVDPPGMTIKSTHFQMRDEGAEIVLLNGRGWGHGLGLCQWGAEGMARRGLNAERILRHYFPGSKLVKAYD